MRHDAAGDDHQDVKFQGVRDSEMLGEDYRIRLDASFIKPSRNAEMH